MHARRHTVRIQRARRGFTLLEILLSITLIAILAGLAFPSITQLIQNRRLKTAAESASELIQTAQTTARQEQRPIYLALTYGNNWCLGATTATACDCHTAGSCDIGAINSTDYPQITLTSSNFSDATLLFSALHGRPSARPLLAFNATAPARRIQLTLNAVGILELCADNIGGYPACSS